MGLWWVRSRTVCWCLSNIRRQGNGACCGLLERAQRVGPTNSRRPGQASESERRSGTHNHNCPLLRRAGPQRAHQLASVVMGPGVRRDDELMELARSDDQIGFPVYGIDAVNPPSTGIAWPLT